MLVSFDILYDNGNFEKITCKDVEENDLNNVILVIDQSFQNGKHGLLQLPEENGTNLIDLNKVTKIKYRIIEQRKAGQNNG